MGNMQFPIKSEGLSPLFLLCHRKESIFVALQLWKRKKSSDSSNRSSVKELFGFGFGFFFNAGQCNHISQWPAFSWFLGKPVSRFCLAWPELNLSLLYDKQVPTCQFTEEPTAFLSHFILSWLVFTAKILQAIKKKALRNPVWRICVWAFQSVQQLKPFNSLFTMWKPGSEAFSYHRKAEILSNHPTPAAQAWRKTRRKLMGTPTQTCT